MRCFRFFSDSLITIARKKNKPHSFATDSPLDNKPVKDQIEIPLENTLINGFSLHFT